MYEIILILGKPHTNMQTRYPNANHYGNELFFKRMEPSNTDFIHEYLNHLLVSLLNKKFYLWHVTT